MASLNVLMMLTAVPSYFFVLLPIRNFAKYIKEGVVRERYLSFNSFMKLAKYIKLLLNVKTNLSCHFL